MTYEFSSVPLDESLRLSKCPAICATATTLAVLPQKNTVKINEFIYIMLKVPLKELIYHNSLFNSRVKNVFYYLLETFNTENKIVYGQFHSSRNQGSEVGQFI